ncbi:cysteine--tRNA ligase, partial [Candidatus Poribacteria bacterium]|nr:cysteine--tRNA ligase [Candidatus Poribacteria bacterium]
FNTALGLAVLFELVMEMNSFLQNAEKSENKIFLLNKAANFIKECGTIFNLFQSEKKHALGNEMVESLLNIIIELRNSARTKKDWAASDYIRDKLKALGIDLEDSSGSGSRWRIRK